ncbi:MAG: 23S rRNA (uracil(1939)-C(5))-methyltransferase RlmD [Ruminococcus sp.]|nr:23S rRNA (uracil(1939)-C(5))-methyltransferase RlmD [Ruminococcus sp.]
MKKHTVKIPGTGELRCTCFKRCGGCQLDMSYKEQLEWKQQKAERMFSRFCQVEPVLPMEKPYHYRNKVKTAFTLDAHSKLLSGVYQSGSGRVTATEDCMLEDEICTRAVLVFKQLMSSFKLRLYDPSTRKGTVRHLLTRYSRATGQLMVCICIGSESFPSKEQFAREFKRLCPQLETLVLNINTKPLPLTLGDKNIVLSGSGYIEDELLGKRFRISPQSFYQVNSVQTGILYSEAIKLAELKQDDVLIDAYCGTGTIGILCADSVSRVIGAELDSAACKDAEVNICLNHLENVTVINEDAGRFMSRLADENAHIDVVVTDPPRAGCDKRFLDSLAKLSPDRVVYISCRIESLERDLKILYRLGYKAVKLQPVDMFPHTTGIETIALLKKRQPE